MPFWIRPLPQALTRPIAFLVVVAWLGQMGLLVNRASLEASGNLATDLARYGSDAQWRGVYYRGEKLGFTVSQTVPIDDGFELREDGELQMSLLGATTAAKIRTTARVDRAFALRSFEFSLDPGTGPIKVSGRVEASSPPDSQRRTLVLAVTTSAGTRTETRELSEPPQLALNMARRLADGGLVPGTRHQWSVFDPATLRNAPVIVDVGSREVVRAGSGQIPAFRVDMEFAGLRTTSWVTDTGEVVREESPMGLLSVREPAERARALAVSGQVRADLLAAAAVVPVTKRRIDDPRDVKRLRVRLEGADLTSLDLQGAGQTVDGDVVEIRDAQQLKGPADPDARRYLAPEPLVESDAPEIQAEAAAAVRQVTGSRARAEALTRYVNSIIEKKPTVSLPSAREVLRTRIGDCNEHTVLYVAMARAVGIPSRIAVGLAYVRGAFYYHAWPEVYLDEGSSGGFWFPVDPTFNQFPADSTHVRLARGGLEKQAVIIPLIGRLKMTILDLDLAPGSTPILVGQGTASASSPYIPMPRRESRWCLPCLGQR
jgi:transglutaminase-like putative cysteine protease